METIAAIVNNGRTAVVCPVVPSASPVAVAAAGRLASGAVGGGVAGAGMTAVSELINDGVVAASSVFLIGSFFWVSYFIGV